MLTIWLIIVVIFATNGEATSLSSDINLAEKAPDVMCPTGFSAVGGQYCYLVALKKGDFQQKKDFCYSNGGYLAAPTTESEDNLLSDYLVSLELGVEDWAFWIGLKDIYAENTDYTWLMENTPVTYTNWAVDNPKRGSWQCVIKSGYVKYVGEVGKWHDLYCEFILGAICEADPI